MKKKIKKTVLTLFSALLFWLGKIAQALHGQENQLTFIYLKKYQDNCLVKFIISLKNGSTKQIL